MKGARRQPAIPIWGQAMNDETTMAKESTERCYGQDRAPFRVNNKMGGYLISGPAIGERERVYAGDDGDSAFAVSIRI